MNGWVGLTPLRTMPLLNWDFFTKMPQFWHVTRFWLKQWFWTFKRFLYNSFVFSEIILNSILKGIYSAGKKQFIKYFLWWCRWTYLFFFEPNSNNNLQEERLILFPSTWLKKPFFWQEFLKTSLIMMPR